MQTFNPWGIDSFSFRFDQHDLTEIKEISRQCQIYYSGIEKKRNGSLEEPIGSSDMKEPLMHQFERFIASLRMKNPVSSALLEQPLLKQSLLASLISQSLGFKYSVANVEFSEGKCEVKGTITDLNGVNVESVEAVDCFNPGDSAQFLGAYTMASKKVFISAVSQLSELDFAGRLQEALTFSK